MDEFPHIIDPDGEAMVILQIPDEPFAPWNDGKTEAEVPKLNGPEINEPPQPVALQGELDDTHPNGSPEDAIREAKEHENTVMQNSEANKHKKECLRIQVSARHLTLSSPVFRKILAGDWKEGILLDRKGSVEITTNNWDPEAFLIIMNIIHCQPQNIPQEVTLELLAKLAVIADYYDYQAIVKYFARTWIDTLVNRFPKKYSRDLMLWLWISWFFKLPEFEKSTSIVVSQSEDVITNLGLPIPDKVIDALNSCREREISRIISSLYEKRDSFITRDPQCSFECNSIMLGALIKNLHLNGLLSSEPVAPFPGLSCDGLFTMIRKFKSPGWSTYPYGRSRMHECSTSSFSKLLLNGWERGIPGLRVDDIR